MKCIFKFFIFFVLLLSLLIQGCYSLIVVDYSIHDYKVGIEQKALIGDRIIAWEYGERNAYNKLVIHGVRKDLILIGIDENILRIRYRKYIKRKDRGPSTSNYRDLKYDITITKIITFEDIKIKILKINSKSIIYKILEGPQI